MKRKLLGIITLLLLLSILAYAGVQSIASWFNSHEIVFNQVLKVELNKPFDIKKREPIIKEVVLDYPDEIDTDIERYICEKFGTFDCKTALAIAKAESGLREDAIGININKTVDLGVFQINSVHFKKEGCSPKELLDQYKNVDCAYQIYQSSGFHPWLTFKNDSYLTKLDD